MEKRVQQDAFELEIALSEGSEENFGGFGPSEDNILVSSTSPARDVQPASRRDERTESASTGRDVPVALLNSRRNSYRPDETSTVASLQRQGSDRSRFSQDSGKEGKIRHHHFSVNERLNDVWKSCEIVLDTQLHEIVWATKTTSWQRRIKVTAIESLTEHTYNYAQLSILVRLRSRSLRQTDSLDFTFDSPSDKVDFLNLIRTLRPEIAGALQSKDD